MNLEEIKYELRKSFPLSYIHNQGLVEDVANHRLIMEHIKLTLSISPEELAELVLSGRDKENRLEIQEEVLENHVGEEETIL